MSKDDSRILGFYFSFSSQKRGTHCEIAPSNCWMRSNSLTEFWLELFELKKKCSELIGRHELGRFNSLLTGCFVEVI